MEPVRSKSHLIGDHVILQPHQTIFIFNLKQNGYNGIEKCMDTALKKLNEASETNLLKNTESND